MSGRKLFLFAARRDITRDGTCLILADPKSGTRHFESESDLRISGIQLGDFVHVNVDPAGRLYNFCKTKHTANIEVETEGNVAYILNVYAKLSVSVGKLIFHNNLFGDAICRESLLLGDFRIRVNLLASPLEISNERKLHFEASRAELIKPYSMELSRTDQSDRMDSGYSSVSRESPHQLDQTVGRGFSTAFENGGKIIGRGFQSVKQNPDIIKQRAVVLSSVEKPIGTHYYLWNVDSKTESLFVSNKHHLEQGHFFDGNFKKNADGTRWTCQNYGQPVEQLAEGGINQRGKIFFTVKIENFQPARGNRKYGSAFNKYFGEILEGDRKSVV